MLENPPKPQTNSTVFSLLKDEKIIDFAQKANKEYDPWDKIKYALPIGKVTPLEMWSVVKLVRRMNYVYFSFGSYKFSFFQTDTMSRLLHTLDQNTGGYLGAHSFIPESNRDYYLYSSLMEEAIASSKMEGAATTRKLAKQMLRRKQAPRTHSERMIYNNYTTIEFIKTAVDQPMSPELICQIHQMISNGTLDKASDEGHFRETNNIVVANGINGQVVHHPPKHKQIEPLIQTLCNFCNQENFEFFVHPIIKGIILHFMIAYIHPFTDGNGRTARALLYWYLTKKGYWLTEYMSISRIIQRSKAKYERAFLHTEMDENDLSYFVQYNLSAMEQAFKALKEYIQRKMDATPDPSLMRAIQGLNERQLMLISIFSERKKSILNVKEIQHRFGIANVTARNDIQKLVEIGLVEAVYANKIKVNYVRSARFDEILLALHQTKPQ